jgi:ABC-type multidrug transport system permease subunit
VSFGQAIAAFAPNELLASLLVPLFFLFVVSFCGVVVPPQQLLTFWRSWMWRLTPFTYLLEAMLGVSFPSLYQPCCQEEEVKLTLNSRSSSTTNQFDATRASWHDS